MSENLNSIVEFQNNKQDLEEAMNGLNINSSHNIGSGISTLGSKKPPLNNKIYENQISS